MHGIHSKGAAGVHMPLDRVYIPLHRALCVLDCQAQELTRENEKRLTVSTAADVGLQVTFFCVREKHHGILSVS